jgi:hypothetical protein
MVQAHGSVQARYDAIRLAGLIDAERRLTSGNARVPIGPVWLSVIDERALLAWSGQWSGRPDRVGGWDWRAQRRAAQSTLNRFELAVWSGFTLCGLAIGKPSKGPSHLGIRLIEANPEASHPLKGYVAHCVTQAGLTYARLLEKRQLRLIDPLAGALPKYISLGFRLDAAPAARPYCFLELKSDDRPAF